jgi:hypothetical protein
MSKGLKIGLIVTGAVLGALILTGTGFLIGRHFVGDVRQEKIVQNIRDRFQGMMQFKNAPQQGLPCRPAGNRNRFGQGLDIPQGMMGQPGNRNEDFQQENPQAQLAIPLTIDSAKAAVDTYLTRLNNSDLQLAEIILFSNNAYARIVEKSTGIGAMELLVLGNGRVAQEMGPNMMWNLKYGMMRFGNSVNQDAATTMTVGADQALTDAQKWLDANLSSAKVATTADAFYGYYTIEYTVDGKIAGMLSVNGSTGDIFPHTWHGTFIDLKEY